MPFPFSSLARSEVTSAGSACSAGEDPPTRARASNNRNGRQVDFMGKGMTGPAARARPRATLSATTKPATAGSGTRPCRLDPKADMARNRRGFRRRLNPRSARKVLCRNIYSAVRPPDRGGMEGRLVGPRFRPGHCSAPVILELARAGAGGLWKKFPPGAPQGGDLGAVFPESDRQPREISGSEGGGLGGARPHHGNAQQVALELHQG